MIIFLETLGNEVHVRKCWQALVLMVPFSGKKGEPPRAHSTASSPSAARGLEITSRGSWYCDLPKWEFLKMGMQI